MIGGFRNAAIFGKRFLTGTDPTFKAPFGAEVDVGTESPEQGFDSSRYFDELQRIRQKRGPALSAYQKALGEMPTRETTKPSIGRRIAGAFAGGLTGMSQGPGAGMEAASNFVEAPYMRSLNEYNNRLKGLGESARLEQDETESELKALAEARALGLKYDEYELKKRATLHKMDMDEGDLDVKYGSLDVSRGNLGVNQENAATNRTNAESLRGYRTGQLAVAGRNASTAERNAATNAANAGSLSGYRNRMAGAAERRNEIVGNRRQGQPPSPREQNDAQNVALSQMMRDPKWAPYIKEQDDQMEPYIMADDDGTSTYTTFQRELRRRVERILGGTPYLEEFGDTDFTGGDDDDLIITPSAR